MAWEEARECYIDRED